MPDNFGQTLREGSARYADSVTPGAAGKVRARGDQRRRRTAAAASVAVAAVIIAAGAGGVYALGQPGGAGNPAPATSVTAPAPTSSPTGGPSSTPTIRPTPGGGSTRIASAPASQTAPASTASSGFSELAGQWKQTDGAGEALYVFPDGMIGFGEDGSGAYPLCAGELQPPVDGAYPFTFSAACGPAASGTVTLAEGTLTLRPAGDSGGAGSAITWIPVAGTGPAANLPSSVPPSWLAGTWTITQGDDGDESFTVAPSGAVTWSLVSQLGKTVTGAGTVQLVPGWGYRIATSFGSPAVAGVWPVLHAADGQAILIGGMGALDFHQTSAG